MSIRRGHLPAADHFTTIPNTWARDEHLSLKARGLLLYLTSHREGWEITGIRELCKRAPEGREAMTGAVHELEDAGFLLRVRLRAADGRLSGVDYLLVDPAAPCIPDGVEVVRRPGADDAPVAGNPATGDAPGGGEVAGKPVPGKPATGKPAAGNPNTKKNISSEDQREEDQQQPLPPAAAPRVRSTPQTPSGESEAFQRFYATYPRRQERRKAHAAWVKGGCEAIAERVITGAQRYAADPNRVDQYTKLPATWINAGCWDDDPLPTRSGGSRLEAEDEYRARRSAESLARAAEADARDREQDRHLQLVGAGRVEQAALPWGGDPWSA